VVTTFNSKKTYSKVPVSPFGDDTFIFETRPTKDIKEVFDNLCANFTLNIPLQKSVREFRRKANLEVYFVKKLNYIIIDIDKVKTQSDKELIIDIFREYKCITKLYIYSKRIAKRLFAGSASITQHIFLVIL